MEADWAVEIGGDGARIEVDWAGFVDLRGDAGAADRIGEAREHSALGAALIALNGRESPVFTSKCDVWTMSAGEIDPLEFDCEAGEAQAGLASYIDVMARESAMFTSFAGHEAWARRAALALRNEPVRSGRVDLVVRAAMSNGEDGFGVTLYAAGCGVDSLAAEAAWGEVLRASVVATMREGRASSSIG
ncbi:MAG TPA: hypothetical protein VHX13_10905 [Acidobacteriaceae bacterium]|nr:hypothetical protein [Acidobacteriaceae bacterium]